LRSLCRAFVFIRVLELKGERGCLRARRLFAYYFTVLSGRRILGRPDEDETITTSKYINKQITCGFTLSYIKKRSLTRSKSIPIYNWYWSAAAYAVGCATADASEGEVGADTAMAPLCCSSILSSVAEMYVAIFLGMRQFRAYPAFTLITSPLAPSLSWSSIKRILSVDPHLIAPFKERFVAVTTLTNITVPLLIT